MNDAGPGAAGGQERSTASAWAMPTLAALLLTGLLAACGAPLKQTVDISPWRTLWLVDPFASTEFSPLAALRSHVLSQTDRAWEPPRIVAAPALPLAAHGTPALPAGTLLRVEITVWDKVSCRDVAPAQRRMLPTRPNDAVASAEMATMDAESLPPAEEMRQRTEIWLVPAELAEAHFALGPAWLGNLLRIAGPGRTVYFPPRQDCGALTEALAEGLPKRVFSTDAVAAETLTISARSAFAARIVEACPARVEERQELVTSYQVPAWAWGYAAGAKEQHTQFRGRVVATCATGEREFALGPIPLNPLSNVRAMIESRP